MLNDVWGQHTVPAKDIPCHSHIFGRGDRFPTTAGMGEPPALGRPLGDFLDGHFPCVGMATFKQIEQQRQLGSGTLERALLGTTEDCKEVVALLCSLIIDSRIRQGI